MSTHRYANKDNVKAAFVNSELVPAEYGTVERDVTINVFREAVAARVKRLLNAAEQIGTAEPVAQSAQPSVQVLSDEQKEFLCVLARLFGVTPGEAL